jgi:hypothetical protein
MIGASNSTGIVAMTEFKTVAAGVGAVNCSMAPVAMWMTVATKGAVF